MNLFKSLFLNFNFQRKAFVFLFFLFFVNVLFSQTHTFVFDSIQSAIYHEAIQLKTISTKKKISLAYTHDPLNLATYMSEEVADFYAVIALSSKESFELYKVKNSERISLYESTSLKSPFVKFSLAEFYLHRAILRVLFGEKIKAVFDLKKARSYTLKNVEEYPSFTLNYKPKSLLNILLGSIPPSVKWASGLVSLKGDYNQGVVELNRLLNYTYVSDIYDCFFYEVLTYKVIISQQSSVSVNDNKQLATYFTTLTVKKELPENQLLLYAWADNLLKNGQNEKANKILLSQKRDDDYITFWPIEFLKGITFQNKLDPSCVGYFNSYIQAVHKGNYVNACYQRLAWQLLLNNNLQGYSQMIKKVDVNTQNTEQDQAAFFEFKSNAVPNAQLLKIRLLFDGGYYERAYSEIKKITPEKLSGKLNQLEYYYRMARILDKKQNYSQALLVYNKVIIDGAGFDNYFAANAALNAGSVCEMANDKSKAIFYYKKCLSMTPNQYKESIHQKAKIGLERLK